MGEGVMRVHLPSIAFITSTRLEPLVHILHRIGNLYPCTRVRMVLFEWTSLTGKIMWWYVVLYWQLVLHTQMTENTDFYLYFVMSEYDIRTINVGSCAYVTASDLIIRCFNIYLEGEKDSKRNLVYARHLGSWFLCLFSVPSNQQTPHKSKELRKNDVIFANVYVTLPSTACMNIILLRLRNGSTSKTNALSIILCPNFVERERESVCVLWFCHNAPELTQCIDRPCIEIYALTAFYIKWTTYYCTPSAAHVVYNPSSIIVHVWSCGDKLHKLQLLAEPSVKHGSFSVECSNTKLWNW